MNLAPFDPVIAILAIPAGAAILLALLPGYLATSRLNVLATLLGGIEIDLQESSSRSH